MTQPAGPTRVDLWLFGGMVMTQRDRGQLNNLWVYSLYTPVDINGGGNVVNNPGKYGVWEQPLPGTCLGAGRRLQVG